MDTKDHRGWVIATGFVVGAVLVLNSLIWLLPASWVQSIEPPFEVLILLIPIAILSFLAARYIRLNTGLFGILAFAATFVILVFGFGWRGHDESLDVPFIFALAYATAFLSGFLGHDIRQYLTSQGDEL
ncbi:hypothetical protein HWV07_03895 [Natronomonas salina]|uniref:hypothetical protein n=1 Tax=Natronomonas salina TaxID=1710540 RepID=UPI0015B38F6C|nr:hypothetical protein [Natronomonas salina]QLD88220.1 hypothetical protein HWV07_03895 [Natronomonas salina]